MDLCCEELSRSWSSTERRSLATALPLPMLIFFPFFTRNVLGMLGPVGLTEGISEFILISFVKMLCSGLENVLQ